VNGQSTHLKKNGRERPSSQAVLALSIIAASFSLFIASEEAGLEPQRDTGLSIFSLRTDVTGADMPEAPRAPTTDSAEHSS
jgi:hypothetical protein